MSDLPLASRPKLLGVLLLCCLGLPSAAVEYPLRWHWSNPSPHGNNIVDIAFNPLLNLGIQVAELGQIYTTTDFSLWTPRSSGTSLSLRAVTFLGNNPPRIIITGENGTVLHADSEDSFHPGNLLDGPTSDWLEAVAASPNLLVAVGDNGAIYTSSNGLDWKRQSPTPAISTWLRGVAFGGNAFVTVGEGGFIARSPNGTNWVQSDSKTTLNLNRVTYLSGKFMAVGDSGLTLVSTNAGQSWAEEITGATGHLFHASLGIGASIVIGDEEVRLQESGGPWTDELVKSNAPPAWTYLANVGRSDYFLIGGRTGLMAEGFKTNGAPSFWLPSDRSIRHWLFDSIYITNLYVTVGDRASILTSGNGIDWNLEYVPPVAMTNIFLGVGGNTNLLVAAGSSGSLLISPNIQTNISVEITNSSGGITLSNYTVSSLGVLWFPVEPRPSTDDLQGVTFGQGLHVVAGDNGTILTSPDGTNWTKRSTPTSQLLSGLASFSGGLVAVGDNGTVLSSANGITWISRASGTANWIYKVRLLNDNLVAMGQNGTILTSTNAINWIPRNAGTSSWLTDATFIEDTYFVVGTQGTVLTSTNLSNWTSRGSITKKALYTAATDSTQLLVGGVEGVILRTQVVPDLTPVNILSYAHIFNPTNFFEQNLFLFGGKPDQRFTLDRRSDLDLRTWSTGPLLEFLNGDGTLFFLESVLTNVAPPMEFYEATLLP